MEVISRWKNLPAHIDQFEGFVYVITNNITGKYYIGKKSFWSRRTLKPLKGKKKKRRVIKESDWKDYWGSSAYLQEDIDKYGKRYFSRVIIRAYKTKWEVSYYEAKQQFDMNVLFDKESYNGIINCRLSRRKR